MQTQSAIAVEMTLDRPAEETDAQLVRQAKAGDTQAFGRLVERYMRRA